MSDTMYYEIFFIFITLLVGVLQGIMTACQKGIRRSSSIEKEGGEAEGVTQPLGKCQKSKRACQTKCSEAKSWIQFSMIPYFYKNIVYNALIRLFLENYFLICISALQAMNYLDFSTYKTKVAGVLTIIHLTLIVIGFPIFVAVFFIRAHRDPNFHLTSKYNLNRYGSLYSELKYLDWRANCYHFLFLVRRIILIMQAILIGPNMQYLNILINLITSFCMLTYITHVRPFEETMTNILEFFNEVIILIAQVYHCVVFTDLAWMTAYPALYQSQAGWSFIALVICVQIPVNLIAILGNNVYTFWVRRRRHKAIMSALFARITGGKLVPVIKIKPADGTKLRLNNFMVNETERDLVQGSGGSGMEFLKQLSRKIEEDRSLSSRNDSHLLMVPATARAATPQISGRDLYGNGNLTVENYIIEEVEEEEKKADSYRTVEEDSYNLGNGIRIKQGSKFSKTSNMSSIGYTLPNTPLEGPMTARVGQKSYMDNSSRSDSKQSKR